MNNQEFILTLKTFCKKKRTQSRYRFLTMLLCFICSFALIICLGSDVSGRLFLSHEWLLFGVLLLSFSIVTFLSWFDLKILQQQLQDTFHFGLQFEKEHNPVRKPLHSVQDYLQKNPRDKRVCIRLYVLAVGFLGFLLGLSSIIFVSEISKNFAILLISLASVGIYTLCKQIIRIETLV